MSAYPGLHAGAYDMAKGIASRLKRKRLDEETDLQKYQLAELQATEGHRRAMDAFAEQQALIDLRVKSLDEMLIQAQAEGQQQENAEKKATSGSRKMSAWMAPLKTMGEMALTGAQTEATKAGTEQTKALTEESASRTKGNLLQASVLERELAKGLGDSAAELGQADYANLAAEDMTARGVKFTPGDAAHSIYTQLIGGEAEAKKQELEQLKVINARTKAQATATAAQSIAETARRSSNPRMVLEAHRELLEPEVFSAASKMLDAGLQSENESQFGQLRANDVEKGLSSYFEERQPLARSVREAEVRVENGEKLSRTEQAELKKNKGMLKRLDDEINGLREGLLGKKPQAAASAKDEVPTINTQAEFEALPIGAEFISGKSGRRMRKQSGANR